MRTIEEILVGLDCRNHECEGCPYSAKIPGYTSCIERIYDDCREAVPFLFHENEKLRKQIADKDDSINTLLEVEHSDYWENICKLNARQEIKGKNKYGVPLEENTTLTRKQRIEHLEEELIDALKYCEHLKAVNNDGITANDYQRACLRTAPDDEQEWLENAIYGIVGETGEIVDLIKKYKWQGHDLDPEEVLLELGDLLWYCALLASAINYNLGTVMRKNIEKLEKRYPDGFSKDRSVNRDKD